MGWEEGALYVGFLLGRINGGVILLRYMRDLIDDFNDVAWE